MSTKRERSDDSENSENRPFKKPKHQIFKGGILVYEGTIKERKYHGDGALYEDGKLKYKGTFQNGKLNGHAKQFFPSGLLKYDGEFKDGLYDGEGIEYQKAFGKTQDDLFSPGGIRYQGSWKNGSYHGLGEEYWAFGPASNHYVMYAGYFEDGIRNGSGMEFNDDKSIYRYGNFVNGEFHEGEEYEDGKIKYKGSFIKLDEDCMYFHKGIEYNRHGDPAFACFLEYGKHNIYPNAPFGYKFDTKKNIGYVGFFLTDLFYGSAIIPDQNGADTRIELEEFELP